LWCSWENYIEHNVTLTKDIERKLPAAKKQQQSLLSYEAHEIDHSGPIENDPKSKRQKASDDGAGVLLGGAQAQRLRRGSGDEEEEESEAGAGDDEEEEEEKEEEEEEEQEEDEDTLWDQLCREGPNFNTSAEMRDAMAKMPQGAQVAIVHVQGEENTAGVLTKVTKAEGRSKNEKWVLGDADGNELQGISWTVSSGVVAKSLPNSCVSLTPTFHTVLAGP
jgi:hypothetical protein